MGENSPRCRTPVACQWSPPYARLRLAATMTLLLPATLALSGCGTLKTYCQYSDYKKCIEDCRSYQADLVRRRCESECYENFDWKDSPLLPSFQNLEEKRKRPWFDTLQNTID